MSPYEELLNNAYKSNVTVIEDYAFQSKRIKGLYCDNVIALNKEITNEAEKNCILAEELGHHYTSTGIIVDTNDLNNSKQEYKARVWAYDKQIGIQGLIDAFEYGCRNKHEIADFLEVTEEFLQDAIASFESKYGYYTIYNKYAIYFSPYMHILKMF